LRLNTTMTHRIRSLVNAFKRKFSPQDRRRSHCRCDVSRALYTPLQQLEDRRLLTIDFEFIYEGEVGTGFGFDGADGQAYRDALESTARQFGSQFADEATIQMEVESIRKPNFGLASGRQGLALGQQAKFGDIEVVRNKILSENDINGALRDAVLTVNFELSGAGRKFDIAANPVDIGSNRYDLRAVLMHEFTHILGFQSSIKADGSSPNNVPAGDSGAIWLAFDQFIGTLDGQRIIDSDGVLDKEAWEIYSTSTTFTTGIFFLGPKAVAASEANDNSVGVALYSPFQWEDGSSISHLDDQIGQLNDLLMDKSSPPGPGIRLLADVEKAILEDLGYSFNPPGISLDAPINPILVYESGTVDGVFFVALDSPPREDVTITIESGDEGEAKVSVNSLTFTSWNWNEPQEVFVIGQPDGINDGDQITSISVKVNDNVSGEAYHGINRQIGVVTADTLIVDGTPGDDEINLLLRDSGNVDVEGLDAIIDFLNPSGIVINGSGGNDTLTVEVEGAFFPRFGLFYNGGAGQDDRLSIVGSGTQNAVYTPDPATFGNGEISFGGKSLLFTGLEPVDIAGLATATLSLPNGDDVLTIDPGTDFGTGASQALRVAGTSSGVEIETAAFYDNEMVVIDTTANDGDDTIMLSGADNAHSNGGLTIISGTGNDSLLLSGSVTTSADQIYRIPLTLSSDATLKSTLGNVSVSDKIDLGNHTLEIDQAQSESALDGEVTGTGGLTKRGSGVLHVYADNTYAGDTHVRSGSVWVHSGASAGAGGSQSKIIIDQDAEIRFIDNQQVNRTLDLAGVLSTAGEGGTALTDAVSLAEGASFDVAQRIELSVVGSISGSGGFTKRGLGTLEIRHINNTYGGESILEAGVTVVDGTIEDGSDFRVLSTATLMGTGTIRGAVSVETGGTLSPGKDTPTTAIFSVGSLDVAEGGTVEMEVKGKTAGPQHDHLRVEGIVSLAGSLRLVDHFAEVGAPGDTILLIGNTGADPVVGSFDGLENGATVLLNGEEWQILYDGGDGNDVELAFVTPAVDLGVSINSGTEEDGNVVTLTATASQAVNGDQTVTIVVSGLGITTDDYTLSSTTITIPDGETTGTGTFTIQNDSAVEGPEAAAISIVASSSGIGPGATVSQEIAIIDNNIADFTVSKSDATVSESGTTDTFTVVLTGQPLSNVVLDVFGSDGGEATVSPASLTFTSVNWNVLQTGTIAGVNDAAVDGDQSSVVTVRVNDAASDNAFDNVVNQIVMVTTTDDTIPTLTVTVVDKFISENGGTTTATVTRNTNVSGALTVTLSSSDSGEATVPTTVTIPAGQTASDAFTVTGVDDNFLDGTQTVTVTAAANGLTSGTDTLDVTDADTTPTGFVVTAPNGMIEDVRPTILWNAVDGAVSYNVYLNIDNGGGNVFTQKDVSASQTSLAIPQDLEFARYRVFIEANMPNDVLKKQDAGHTFVVEVKSQLTSIGATTATTPDFTWNRVPGAAQYRIFINVPGGAVTADIADPGSGTTASHTITSALPRNDYKWWLRAIRDVNDTDFLGPWSEASEFSTGGRTKVTSPARNSTVTNSIPEFTWPAVPDALRYETYVSKIGTPGALYRDPGITDTTIRARALEDGDYKVWIRTTQADGSGVWGSGVAFTVATTTTALQTTPSSPLTPGFNTTPAFTWQSTAGATSYDIFLHNGTSSILEEGRTGTSWRPTTALADGAWTWSVRPVNSTGAGPWSAVTAFSTNGLTKLTAPGANTSDTTPEFTWQSVTGAVTYEIQVNNRTTSTANVIREAGLTGTSYTPTTALAAGTYRVWVRAISTTTTGPWSVQFDFVVASSDVEDENERTQHLLTAVRPLNELLVVTADSVVAPTQTATVDKRDEASTSAGQDLESQENTQEMMKLDDQFAAAQEWLSIV
jgi:autotransporter-associated beta strand protein